MIEQKLCCRGFNVNITLMNRDRLPEFTFLHVFSGGLQECFV